MPLTLDADQIEVIREMCYLGTDQLTDLTDRLTNLGDAQQAACERDILEWTKNKFGTVRVHGGIKGTQYNIQEDRDLITDRMRLRLGYPKLTSTAGIPEGDMGAFRLVLPGGWSSDDCSGGDG